MKAFLITVAGISARFNKDLETPCLKCIYYQTNPEHSLLYRMISFAKEYDIITVVGGFQYDALTKYLDSVLSKELREKVILVENPQYETAGSGWSLYVGLKALYEYSTHHKIQFDEILFSEGDLFIDKKSFQNISSSDKSIITVTKDFVDAKKSVALYTDINEIPHYIYDVSHGSLEIKEPFLGIYNSGQIWKFLNTSELFRIMFEINEEKHAGTNLVLINAYFQSLQKEEYELLLIEEWINCNITPAIKTRIFNSHIFLCTQVFCVQICESLSLVRFAILT